MKEAYTMKRGNQIKVFNRFTIAAARSNGWKEIPSQPEAAKKIEEPAKKTEPEQKFTLKTK